MKKKILLGLGAATSVVAPIAAVVSCGDDTTDAESMGVDKGAETKGNDKIIMTKVVEILKARGLFNVNDIKTYRNGNEISIVAKQELSSHGITNKDTKEFAYNFKTEKVIAYNFITEVNNPKDGDVKFQRIYKNSKYAVNFLVAPSGVDKKQIDDHKKEELEKMKKEVTAIQKALSDNASEFAKLK